MTEKILPAIRHDDQMDKILLKTIILQLKICTEIKENKCHHNKLSHKCSGLID